MLRRARAAWPFDVLDLLALVGVGLIGAGCWRVSEALALVVVGVLVLAYAFFAALPPRTGGVS